MSAKSNAKSEDLTEEDANSKAFMRLKKRILAFFALFVFAVMAVVFVVAETLRMQRFEAELSSMQTVIASLLRSYNIQGLQYIIEEFAARHNLDALRVVDIYDSTVARTGRFLEGAEARILVLTDANDIALGQFNIQGSGYALDMMAAAAFLGTYLSIVLIAYLGLRRVTASWMEDHISEPLMRSVENWLGGDTNQPRERRRRDPLELPSITRIASALETARGKYDSAVSRAEGAERIGGVLDHAFALSLEQAQEAVLFMDGDDVIMRCPASSQIREEELRELSGLVTSRKALPALLTDAGYELLDMQAADAPYEMDRCFVQRDAKMEFEFNRLYGDKGQVMLTIKPAQPLEWFDKMLSNALKNSKSGLVVFDTHGQLRLEMGETGRVMIPRVNATRNYSLSDLLAQFPKLEGFAHQPVQTFDFVSENKEVFRIWIKSNAAGWVAIYHQDVSEMLQREKQLIESQRLKELGEIASGIAHDFNNSLGVVIGQLQLAMGSENDQKDQRQTALSTAKQAAEQASAVVAQLMSYSRKQVLNAKVINVDRLIRDNHRVLATALTGKHSLELDLQADHLIYIDPDYLSAAIMNLVINARDAMTGNGTVTISTRMHAPQKGKNGRVELVVTDTGTGIPAHIQDKIFAPFFSTKPEGDGNGLGLSMVKGFVEQSNGEITCESSIEGTKMHISFPAIETQHLTDTPPPAKPISKAVKADMRVLLVDDDRLVLATQAALLRQAGFSTEEYDSPYAALDLLRKDQSFDVMILDMQMPEMHGLDLAAKVRELTPDLPIIACSGNFDPENVSRAQALKISKLVEKPASLESLQQAVLECATNKRPGPKLVVAKS